MEIVINPEGSRKGQLLQRPQQQREDVDTVVRDIVELVKGSGDEALIAFSKKFDGADLQDLRVGKDEMALAASQVPSDLKTAIRTAYQNIHKFHESCFIREYPAIETMPGITCCRKSLPIQKVGLYVPGGSAPLFSTVLMLGIPSQIAGNERVVLCSPTDTRGLINPIILYTASLCGIDEIYKTGGAQAIAAMTYGTASIPAVDKIFGPGNAFVTRAKELAQQHGVAIDMPAGPSEVLVIADCEANPIFVAADLLAQAEHGHDSQVILLTTCAQLAQKVSEELDFQLDTLSRKQIAEKALANSRIIVLENIEECIAWSDFYAPEHLIINTTNATEIAHKVKVAGSIFIGPYTCESLGDYASGTNHTLPTYGYARNYSGVSVDSFVNKVTYQQATYRGIENLGPTVELMAAAEGLDAHQNAVRVRLEQIKNRKS
ncbi:MAG: histidinol dehydrogenase [Nonlabens sp.]